MPKRLIVLKTSMLYVSLAKSVRGQTVTLTFDELLILPRNCIF